MSSSSGVLDDSYSQQLLEFINTQTSVMCNATHRKRVDRIRAGNGKDAGAVGHDDMLALPDDLEAGLLQSANRLEVRDAWDLGHGPRPRRLFPAPLYHELDR